MLLACPGLAPSSLLFLRGQSNLEPAEGQGHGESGGEARGRESGCKTQRYREAGAEGRGLGGGRRPQRAWWLNCHSSCALMSSVDGDNDKADPGRAASP